MNYVWTPVLNRKFSGCNYNFDMLKQVSLFNCINVYPFDFAGTTLFVLKICEGVQLYFLGLWYGEAGGVSASRSNPTQEISHTHPENFSHRDTPVTHN